MPWTLEDKETWRNEQNIKRSYQEEVLAKIDNLKSHVTVTSYGALSYDPARYPLFYLRSQRGEGKKTILITGGVHGYETSGVQGALRFMETELANFSQDFDIICFPCVSPWAYETINRWNPLAIDPNRSFFVKSPAEECHYFLEAMNSLNVKIFAHFDLHETTDTDNTVFRPALQERDGKVQEFSEIPDGFYLVGDTRSPEPAFQKAIIDSVKKITHIAPPDGEGKIIGVRLAQEGVVNYDKRKLFLCGGFSDARFITTTEVYPDSPKATAEICTLAQVAALTGGINFVKSLES